MRVSSGAFRTSDAELSLDRVRLLEQTGSIGEAFGLPNQVGVAELTAEQFRLEGLEPRADPLHNNPAHAVVTGPLSKGQATRLANSCRFLSAPD